MIHSTEKSMKELGDKVGAGDKTRIETAITELKDAMKSDNADTIKAKSTALAQASMKLGEALYGPAGGRRRDAGPGAVRRRAEEERRSGDNVVDADFEEVKDDKKKSA
jgi:molecular chaperone DnaK